MGRKHCDKEEIAHYEQFLLFPQCFQKVCFQRASEGITVWEWVKEDIVLILVLLSPLPNEKFLDWSKLKAFADDEIKVLKMMNFVLNRVENIVGKGENARIFSLSHNVFKGLFTHGLLD